MGSKPDEVWDRLLSGSHPYGVCGAWPLLPANNLEENKIMDKLTEQKYTGYYNSKNDLTLTGVSNNAVIATDFNKLIDEVDALRFQIKNLKEIQKWKNWKFR